LQKVLLGWNKDGLKEAILEAVITEVGRKGTVKSCWDIGSAESDGQFDVEVKAYGSIKNDSLGKKQEEKQFAP
jgi:hypothetical protein